MGVICKKKGVGGGGGGHWVTKIFGATNCEHRRHEATLGGSGGMPPTPTIKVLKNEDHCGSGFCFLCILYMLRISQYG